MTNFNLLTDVPIINNRKQLAQWLKPLYILSDYMTDYDNYRIFQRKLFNIIKGCYDIRACREYKIRFKFYKKDLETQELQFRHFVINTIFWYPFVELNDLEVLDKSFIVDCVNDIPDCDKYINNKLLRTLKDYHIKSTKINYATSEVLHNLRKVSEEFSLIMGLNFSATTFIDLYNENNEIRELMECTFDDSLQPHEIEKLLDEYEEREIAILESLPDNPLGVMLRANTGVKKKQLREFTISEGFKPDLNGQTIPQVVENSTMIRGLDRPSYVYTDAMSSRKSLIMNKKVMGKAG